MKEWIGDGARRLAEAKSPQERALIEANLKRMRIELANFIPPGEFSEYTKRELVRAGFSIYTLTGSTIRDLLSEDLKVSMNFLRGLPPELVAKFMEIPSMQSEVAVDGRLLAQSARGATFAEQKIKLDRYSRDLQFQLGDRDIIAIMANPADYASLYLMHLKETGQKLIPAEVTIRTGTILREASRRHDDLLAEVNRYSSWHDIGLSAGIAQQRASDIFAMPVVVPRDTFEAL